MMTQRFYSNLLCSTASIAAALLITALLMPATTLAQEAYAITNVSVVPMDSETILQNQTVLVKGNRITAVLPAQSADIPPGYELINGQGQFLAPGLADMHAHPMTQANLDAFLANGVTLIRSMWGEPVVLQMREEIAKGKRDGPRIITGGPIVDGDPVIHYGTDQVLDRNDAERVVTAQKAAGYDFIKIYSNLSLAAFDAIAAVAKAENIPFAGHVPHQVPMSHALRAGMQTSEHMIGISEATLREGQQYVWSWSPEFGPFAERLGNGELTMDQLFDEQKLRDLAGLTASTGHWLVPTLVVLRGVSLDPDEMAAEFQNPDIRYTDFTVKTFWRMMQTMGPPKSPAVYAGQHALFEHSLKQFKAFHDAGVRILAGTDALNPFVNLGFSVVQELQFFVEAGLTPYEALRTATVNAAEFAGEAGKAGMIGTGARADLVLLQSNPLENVAAYREITGVFANGHWHHRQDLDQRLAGLVAQSEKKASVFAADATWTVDEGEFVPLYAGFETFAGERKTGTERIARAYTGEATTALLSERRGEDGGTETYRVQTDEAGNITHMQRRRVNGAEKANLEITRSEAGYVIERAGSPAQAIDTNSGAIITHTALDSLVL